MIEYIPIGKDAEIKLELLKNVTPKNIVVKHERFIDKKGWFCGGLTMVTINTPDFGMIQGFSRCMIGDTFTKKIGYRLAIEKVLNKWISLKIKKAKETI